MSPPAKVSDDDEDIATTASVLGDSLLRLADLFLGGRRMRFSCYCSITSNGWGKMPKTIIPIPRKAIRNLLKAGTAMV